jgi:hypothetical protein
MDLGRWVVRRDWFDLYHGFAVGGASAECRAKPPRNKNTQGSHFLAKPIESKAIN